MATKERREELIVRMEQLGPIGAAWIKNLQNAKCPLCGKDVNEADFRDQLSRDEYAISHICQSCQDVTFASGE